MEVGELVRKISAKFQIMVGILSDRLDMESPIPLTWPRHRSAPASVVCRSSSGGRTVRPAGTHWALCCVDTSDSWQTGSVWRDGRGIVRRRCGDRGATLAGDRCHQTTPCTRSSWVGRTRSQPTGSFLSKVPPSQPENGEGGCRSLVYKHGLNILLSGFFTSVSRNRNNLFGDRLISINGSGLGPTIVLGT